MTTSFDGNCLAGSTGIDRVRVMTEVPTRIGLLLLVAVVSLSMLAASAAAGTQPNTFTLGGAFHGTIKLTPKTGCSLPDIAALGPGGGLYNMTGKVSGITGVQSWTLNLNATKTGTFKITSGFNAAIGVTLQAIGAHVLATDTFDAVSGTVTMADQTGSLSIGMTNPMGIKITLAGSWKCPS